ncbi:MAG TPA: HD domain-containing protein [Candidatus Acidoferrales bacterium]|jgi:3'-5' exoribonuclease|nr:HD domain-containing protein [Candidatus Acidoferrales bacterium]
MKSPYVNELEPNKVITTSFLVHSKEIRQKKTGEFYLSLLLGDRTGELDSKMWDNVQEVLDDFDRDDFVKVKGMIQVFHNRPQLTIHKVRRMDESEIDFADYFPSSKRDPDEMWAELRGIVAGLGNPHLKALLEAMLGDEDVARRYRRAPAAKQIHHAFLGGLIEHVLSVCALARLTAGHYPIVDYDLLVTGVILHDIGKIYELNYERGFSYSNEGQLIGHISIAMRMVGDRLRGLPDFPPRLRTLVEHMILSHHGQLEYGSPKLPQFPEALLLHYLDDVDSKMECMRALLENDRQVDGCFTSYNTAISRTVLKKERFLSDAPVSAQPHTEPRLVARPLGSGSPPTAETAAAKQSDVANGSAAEKPAVEKPAVTPPKPTVPAERALRADHPPKADHPLFAAPPGSAFANKLKQALQPAGTKQDG